MKFGLCFVEDAIFGYKYFVTDFVVLVNLAGVLPSGITISQWLPVISNFRPVGHEWYVKEHILSEDGHTRLGFEYCMICGANGPSCVV